MKPPRIVVLGLVAVGLGGLLAYDLWRRNAAAPESANAPAPKAAKAAQSGAKSGANSGANSGAGAAAAAPEGQAAPPALKVTPLEPDAPGAAPAPDGKAKAPGLAPQRDFLGPLYVFSALTDRPLFDPTRRPPPPPPPPVVLPPPPPPPPQVAMVGVGLDGKNAIALARLASGQTRRLHVGDSVEGWRVTEITSSNLRLTLGERSHNVRLEKPKRPA